MYYIISTRTSQSEACGHTIVDLAHILDRFQIVKILHEEGTVTYLRALPNYHLSLSIASRRKCYHYNIIIIACWISHKIFYPDKVSGRIYYEFDGEISQGSNLKQYLSYRIGSIIVIVWFFFFFTLIDNV